MSSEDDLIDASIERHGWHAVAIIDHDPPFLYTCGLLTRADRHPELLVLGLDPPTAHAIVSDLVTQITNGRRFATLGRTTVLDGLPIAFEAIHRSQHELYLGSAMAHARRHHVDLAALQIFWPDKQDRFPFELACDSDVRASQPRLAVPATASELRSFRDAIGVD